MQELKESVQKMTTESQDLGSSVRELKELLSQSRDKSTSHSSSKLEEPELSTHSGERLSHTSGVRSAVNDQPWPTKLDFPRYSGDDPTVWLDRVMQYFDYQGTRGERKVVLAAFHLDGEANQWWQWLKKVYHEENKVVTWEKFKKELLVRFGPTEADDFDEALSRICQHGTLKEYQREFERLANRVDGWPQKALVGTFMGGLKEDIASETRMFKPKTLFEAIELARIKDESMNKQRRQNKVGNAQTSLTTKSVQKTISSNTIRSAG